jgi:hypothetical protein
MRLSPPSGLSIPRNSRRLCQRDSIPRAATTTGSKFVLGGSSTTASSSRDGESSSREDHLRQEVERLGRVVEMLTAQQVQQQPQVIYQQGSVPDDSPPRYLD